MMLDVGMNFNIVLSRTNNPERFTSSNGYFSYLQFGDTCKK